MGEIKLNFHFRWDVWLRRMREKRKSKVLAVVKRRERVKIIRFWREKKRKEMEKERPLLLFCVPAACGCRELSHRFRWRKGENDWVPPFPPLELLPVVSVVVPIMNVVFCLIHQRCTLPVASSSTTSYWLSDHNHTRPTRTTTSPAAFVFLTNYKNFWINFGKKQY